METCEKCGVTSGIATNRFASTEALMDSAYMVIHWPNETGALWLVKKTGIKDGSITPIARLSTIELVGDMRNALENLMDAQNGPPLERPVHKTAWEMAMVVKVGGRILR